ncbi:MAG TPA: VWD domain-containing protein [Acidimicrobiales bacterium]|nr:VWD domain-containing protein [Acidimicrobiales bacterium]
MGTAKVRVRRPSFGSKRVSALVTVALMTAGLCVALVQGASPSAGALSPAASAARPAATGTKVPVAVSPAYKSIFTPQLTLPATVKAPSAASAGAFAALNNLIDVESLFGDAVVGMRVALDRERAALSAHAKTSAQSQADASANYALVASRLVGTLPSLQSGMARALLADKMSLTLTPAQFEAGKARLLRGLPAYFTHVLQLLAAPYQPSSVPEVAALRADILDAAPIQRALARMAPRALVLPAALAASAATAPEVRLAAALETYADDILRPVPASRLGAASRLLEPGARLVPDEEAEYQASEGLHIADTAFQGVAAGAQTFGGEAGVGAAETSFTPLGEAFGEAFAYYAYQQATSAFGGGEGEGGGAGNGSSNSAATWGDPHELTFSGADYDFQAAGEFTLVKSTTDNLEIQVRQQPFPGSGEIAVDTAAAMRVGSSVVELAANKSGELELWVNRQATPYASRVLPGGGRIAVENSRAATVTWPDGTEVTVFSGATLARGHGVTTCNSADNINLTIKVAPSRVGHLTGLLGDPGASPDELLGGNGASYSLDQLAAPWQSSRYYDVLYRQFAASWRVSRASSLFYYAKGTSTATFTNLAFPSRVLTLASLPPASVAAAERDCKAAGVTNPQLLADCVYDAGLTGASGACFAADDAQVQATTGGATATGLPESSGILPPSGASPISTTTTTQATTPPPAATGTGITIGSAPSVTPGVAVDASGTAYVVWQQGSGDLSFCKLSVGAKACRHVILAAPPNDVFFGRPTVLLEPGHIYVLDLALGGADDLEGMSEFVSTDGGSAFTREPYAVGSLGGGNSGPAGPPIELPGGDFGAGYVIPESDPVFQANSLASPADQSEAASAPFATLQPRPANAYTVGSLGGVFGSQLSGSTGVLGVFEAFPGKGSSPCPSSASAALVYGYAPANPSTTPAELSASPGASSPWRPLAKVDCGGTDPAVGGGPSGLGLLETNESSGAVVQYRQFSPSSGFGPAVTITSDEVAGDGSLSQDGAGEVFATWLDSSTGVDLAYSSDGGAHWNKPRILFSNGANPAGIGLLASAVGPSGQGWAVYAVGKDEHAQRFRMS